MGIAEIKRKPSLSASYLPGEFGAGYNRHRVTYRYIPGILPLQSDLKSETRGKDFILSLLLGRA